MAAFIPTEPLLSKVYFFHDVRITCQTNHPAIAAALDQTLEIFPEPPELRGDVTYAVLCYDSISQFPMQLPRRRVRTDTMRLLTNTKLKYYRGTDSALQYQSYQALPCVNEAALSVIDAPHGVALSQLARPERYQAAFLRRYVFLLALGQLMQAYGFVPFHAGAVTAPGNDELGALILGASGSGKTTLSIGCVSSGFGLLGDDLVMLRAAIGDGSIGAYAISHEVSVRSGSLDLWPTPSFLHELPADLRDKRYCTIEQMHPGAARTQTSIRLLLFPALSAARQSTATRLSKAAALQELVDVCLDKKPLSFQAQEQLFVFLSKLAEQAAGYRLHIAKGANDGPQLVHSLLTGNQA